MEQQDTRTDKDADVLLDMVIIYLVKKGERKPCHHEKGSLKI